MEMGRLVDTSETGFMQRLTCRFEHISDVWPTGMSKYLLAIEDFIATFDLSSAAKPLLSEDVASDGRVVLWLLELMEDSLESDDTPRDISDVNSGGKLRCCADCNPDDKQVDESNGINVERPGDTPEGSLVQKLDGRPEAAMLPKSLIGAVEHPGIKFEEMDATFSAAKC